MILNSDNLETYIVATNYPEKTGENELNYLISLLKTVTGELAYVVNGIFYRTNPQFVKQQISRYFTSDQKDLVKNCLAEFQNTVQSQHCSYLFLDEKLDKQQRDEHIKLWIASQKN